MSLVGRRAQNHPQQVAANGPVDAVDDRRTPRSLFDPLDREFGFTLDVSASAENALCDRFYDLAADGLASSWRGERVWCNPPYSNIRPWVEKAWLSKAELVVMLLPANRTEQGWWQDFVERERRMGHLETRFLRGRLRFDVPAGTYSDPRGNRPPFGVVLVIWRNP